MRINQNKFFGKVAVLSGGNSSEREISVHSGNAVLNGLNNSNIDAHIFDPSKQSLVDLKNKGFIRAFNVLHGGYGENGQIQGALDIIKIPYTGSGVLGSAIGIDKFRTKLIWQQLGIPTPKFIVLLKNKINHKISSNDIIKKLGLPLFVKSAIEGSSLSIIKVKNLHQLSEAILKLSKFNDIILVEKSIENGKEYTASIVGDLDLPIIRIIPDDEFYSYKAKYLLNTTKYIIPSGLSKEKEIEIKYITKKAFLAIGCSSIGRVDFIIDHKGNLYLLEVNTIPGMTKNSLLPKSANYIGISYKELVVQILSLTKEKDIIDN